MKIPRNANKSLLEWKNRANRLPLIIKGVRQVGKTMAITDFGRNHFPSFLKVDLEKEERARSVFRSTKDPKEIIKLLEIIYGTEIKDSGLLFLDEIHSCPPALTALKYFAEDKPNLAIVAAGSLLGILLAGILQEESYSFPVGKVEFMTLPPITFSEFAAFLGAEDIWSQAQEQLASSTHTVNQALHEILWDLWKKYLIVGGMPQVITDFISATSKKPDTESLRSGFLAARNKQEQLLTAYDADVAKHSGKVNAQHVIRVLKTLPAKLAAAPYEGTQRFTFKNIVPGIRGYERLAGAIDWLTSAGLVSRIPLVKNPLPPLKAFSDEHLFKLFMFDTGLLGALAGIDPSVLYQFNFGMYKGYFAENFVLQEMRAKSSAMPIVSWYTNQAEIEFLIERASGIVPIEVKSSNKFKSRSLTSFEKRFKPSVAYVFSANTGSHKGERIELPIYFAEKTLLTP